MLASKGIKPCRWWNVQIKKTLRLSIWGVSKVVANLFIGSHTVLVRAADITEHSMHHWDCSENASFILHVLSLSKLPWLTIMSLWVFSKKCAISYLFTEVNCKSLCLVCSQASKPYHEGELIKTCMLKAAEIVCPEKQQSFDEKHCGR